MAASWKPILVTTAVVGVVLVVDDATTAGPGAPEQSPAGHAAPVATPVPTAPLTDEPIPHHDGLGVIQTTGLSGRTVALTFDDGPEPEYTEPVLDILDRHSVKATFCVIGTNVQAHPKLVREIADRGHTLCDHTITHDLDLPDRGAEQIRGEIGGTLDQIRAAVPDATVPFYRAPGGNFSADVIAIAASYDQQPLGWSVDPRDWTDATAEEIHSFVLEETVPGSIVLLHDGGGGQSETVAALDGILTGLRDAGFEFVIPAR